LEIWHKGSQPYIKILVMGAWSQSSQEKLKNKHFLKERVKRLNLDQKLRMQGAIFNTKLFTKSLLTIAGRGVF
jgi:hypothetical protein